MTKTFTLTCFFVAVFSSGLFAQQKADVEKYLYRVWKLDSVSTSEGMTKRNYRGNMLYFSRKGTVTTRREGDLQVDDLKVYTNKNYTRLEIGEVQLIDIIKLDDKNLVLKRGGIITYCTIHTRTNDFAIDISGDYSIPEKIVYKKIATNYNGFDSTKISSTVVSLELMNGKLASGNFNGKEESGYWSVSWPEAILHFKGLEMNGSQFKKDFQIVFYNEGVLILEEQGIEGVIILQNKSYTELEEEPFIGNTNLPEDKKQSPDTKVSAPAQKVPKSLLGSWLAVYSSFNIGNLWAEPAPLQKITFKKNNKVEVLRNGELTKYNWAENKNDSTITFRKGRDKIIAKYSYTFRYPPIKKDSEGNVNPGEKSPALQLTIQWPGTSKEETLIYILQEQEKEEKK